MANEKMRDQNLGTDPNREREQDKGKAMGAGATSGTQGQQGGNLGRQSEQGGNLGRQSESAGQGGGVQGTGQRNPNPTQGQTGQEGHGLRDEESASKRKPDQEEY